MVATAVLTIAGCKQPAPDGRWTAERRQLLVGMCHGVERDSAQCTCFVNEVTTAVTYKEFLLSGHADDVLAWSHKVCW